NQERVCSPVAFPQYRIPVRRLKEEWAARIARKVMRARRPQTRPSRIRDNSEPWISNPSSVAEFLEVARKVNETVNQWSPQHRNSSKS
ncbi:MAG: hypothetical protein ACKO2G_00910, partial [Verrucomicrobiales bacterium]